MKDNFFELTSNLEAFFTTSTNVEELINAYEIFDNGKFPFFYYYFKTEIAERIVKLSIPFQENDFLAIVNNQENKIEYYKFIAGVAYFDNVHELRNKLKNGFYIRGLQFLKSGYLPSRKGLGEFIEQTQIIKVVRGLNPKNRSEEKEVFNKLILKEEDLEYLKKNTAPLIINL